MTHTIDLIPSLEALAAGQARERGQSVDEYLPDVLAQAVTERAALSQTNANPPPRTGADVLAQWEREGAFLPAEDLPDTPALARRLRERAQRREV
jgi:hypothetical protein